MDAILFSLKRSFHLSNALGRWFLKSAGLTPSRFDMLYLVYTRHPGHVLDQCDLRRALGVTGATVSRMLRSLEELDLVTRRRSLRDARKLTVRFTVRGLALIRRVIRFALRKRGARILVSTFLTEKWWDDDHEFVARDALHEMLRTVRARLFDRATLYYPWHPDD